MPRTKEKKYKVIVARESVLVDAQILLQRALNKTYGNPRDFEETNPKKADRMWRNQRHGLAEAAGVSRRRIARLFADDSNMQIKDLAEYLKILGFDLVLDIRKSKS